MALITQVWLALRVGKSSMLLAIATFFIGPPGAVSTFFKQRGDKATAVTVPFIANLVFSVLFYVSFWQIALPIVEAQTAAALAESVLAGPAASAPTPASAPERAQALVSTVAAASAAMPASEASAPVAPTDPVDDFSAALKVAGLQHTVTRFAATVALPDGVADAALFSVAPLGSAAAVASTASAPGVAELSATLFRCTSAIACRNLAAAYLQQSGPEKRRVQQKGLLLLAMPAATASDTDLTPAAVASAFRKMP
ncbi:MAG: hypothetical protein ABI605_11955 [Rhizobacter sp.]